MRCKSSLQLAAEKKAQSSALTKYFKAKFRPSRTLMRQFGFSALERRDEEEEEEEEMSHILIPSSIIASYHYYFSGR